MTYQYIPNPNDKLSKSQADIKADFTILDTTIGINHYPPTDATNPGKHKFVEMPVLVAKPTIASAEGGLYTKASGQSQLFFTSDTPGQEYQMTRAIDASIATFGSSTKGWSFLPGGILIQWGVQAGSNSTTVPVTFPVTFTNPAYSVSIIPERAASNPGDSFSTAVLTGSMSTSGFTIANIGGHTMVNWYWMAVGK